MPLQAAPWMSDDCNFFGTSITGCAQKSSVDSEQPNQKREEHGEPGFDSSDGLLKLELIGYANAIERYNELDVNGINEKKSASDSFILFVGRPTCEWYRKLALSLQQVTDDKKATVFYLDSTNTETDADLASFREDYGIETAPDVILFDGDGKANHLDIDIHAENMNNEVRNAFDRV